MKSGKTTQYYWLETELAKHYSDLNFEKGVDLDRNGQIKGSERTDLNDDGEVDVSELKQFLKANQPALKNLGRFFKSFYSHGQVLSPDNPIHNLLLIESEVVPPHLVKAAYQKVMQILSIVRLRSLPKMNPESKLKTVYNAAEAVGIVLKEQDDDLFTHNINEGRGVLDCDTSSFVVLAITHEFNWPVYLVGAPEHMFIRWDDGKYTLNMDAGKVYSDQYYKRSYNIPSKSIENGVYLKNLNSDEALAQYLTNRGVAKKKLGNLEGAVADYTEAIKLDPNHPEAYNNRGYAKFKLGDLRGAIADYTEAIKLNPNDPDAYYNRGVAKYELGNLEGAVADYTKAIKLNPNNSKAYNNRGVAKFILGKYIEALEDFLKVRELESERHNAAPKLD